MNQSSNIKLVDPHGRRFPYLRLSITDICNFSCDYCLPNGYQCDEKKVFLNLEEIKNAVTAFAELGTYKIRLTGGEPTLRKDFTQIISLIRQIPGIEQVAVTTNGYRLESNIEKWVDAGLTHLNVSVDTLDPKLFNSLTGHNRLKEILKGIDKALELPIEKVKLNAVLLKNINSHQIDQYTDLIRDKDLSIRFIELMQTGDNLEYFKRYHVSSQQLKNTLFSKGWTEKLKDASSGPAQEYVHPDHKGSFGIIAPYSKNFCDSCNRLRLSSTGSFHLCLFGEQGYSVRHLLQSTEQKDELKAHLIEALSDKPKKHFLDQQNTGITANLSSIGG